MGFNAAIIDTGLRHLKRRDPVIRGLIQRVGPFTLRPNRHAFRMLARAIIAQQISGKAAKSIYDRVKALAGAGGMTAHGLARLSTEQLRAAGVSAQKAAYLHDLAAKIVDRTLCVARLGRQSDEEVIEELTQVKGIGRWTAQMFLIFCLGRLDVFPHDDLGIRLALEQLYRLPELPNAKTSIEIAAPWRPYATIASWYCWRSRDPAYSQPRRAKDPP